MSNFEAPKNKRARKSEFGSIEEYIDQKIEQKLLEIERVKGHIMGTYKFYRQKVNYLVKLINEAGDEVDYAQSFLGEMNEMESDPVWKIVEKEFKKQMNSEGFGADFKFICKKDPCDMGGESGYLHYIQLTLEEY